MNDYLVKILIWGCLGAFSNLDRKMSVLRFAALLIQVSHRKLSVLLMYKLVRY